MQFDRLAPHYRWLEGLTAGPLLQRARTTWLDALGDRTRLLSAGEGHGRFAAAVARRHPALAMTCGEASPAMARVGRARGRRAGSQAAWLRVDVEHLALAPGTFDAIATHFFLDCFPPAQLAAVIDRLSEAAREDAVWLVTDFAMPPRGPARWRAQAMHACMYAAFRAGVGLPAERLTPPDPYLRQRGFHLAGRVDYSWGLVRADLWRR